MTRSYVKATPAVILANRGITRTFSQQYADRLRSYRECFVRLGCEPKRARMLVRKIVEHSGNMSGSDGLEWRWASKARSALGCYAHNLASVPEEMYNAFFRAMFPAEMLETYPWTYRKITPDERGWYR